MRSTLRRLLTAVVSAVALVSSVASAPAARERIPYGWQKCSHVNAKYRHGVGKRFAHDRTTGVPVTNFYRSTKLYNMNNGPRNKATGEYDLDRDNDDIACER